MDFRIFLGSFERDFGSCGWKKFACVKLNLDSIFVYLSRQEFDGDGGSKLGGCQSLRDFSLESSENTAARESIIWEVEDKATV